MTGDESLICVFVNPILYSLSSGERAENGLKNTYSDLTFPVVTAVLYVQ